MILLLVMLVIIYFFGALYPYYNSLKKDEFTIPGLDTNFVPQGIDYDKSNQTFFICGYMSDGHASRVYILNEKSTGSIKFVSFKNQKQEYKGHFGGMAVYKNNIFIASDGYILRVDKNQVLQSEIGESLNIIDSFKTGNGADSITIFNDTLFVGEFYRAGKYETNTEHHITLKDGKTNKALAFCYTLDLSKPYGVDSTTPKFGLSLPNQVQGLAFALNGDIVVSTSYSIFDSKILLYSNVFGDDNKQVIKLLNKQFPVYILSSNNLKLKITAPAMSEEIVVKDNRIYILYESASKKYKFFNRTRIKRVQSILIED